MFQKKKPSRIEAYIFRAEDAFGKVSYAHDATLSGYIREMDFLPRTDDVVLYNKVHYKVDKIVIDYQEKVVNILMSSSKVNVQIQK